MNLFVLFLVVLVLLAVLLAVRWPAAAVIVKKSASTFIIGGAPTHRVSPHVVVDTLNLTHWLEGGVSPELIVRAIDRTAPLLRARHADRVMYVLKDRTSAAADPAFHAALQAAAVRNRVYVYVAERYADPPAAEADTVAAEHSQKGRDDFFMCLLAAQHRCQVLSGDRLSDFARFRATVPPFHVYEFAYWRELPDRIYIRPDAGAYAKLKKPVTVRFDRELPGLKAAAA